MASAMLGSCCATLPCKISARQQLFLHELRGRRSWSPPRLGQFLNLSTNRRIYCALSSESTTTKKEVEEEEVPLPIVVIDQDADPHTTVVEVSFGDRLGALLDTMKSLRDLGLTVVKGNVKMVGNTRRNRFSITRADNGRKVEDPELLESIRLTIIDNLLKYHPESSARLAMGEAFGIKPPKKQEIQTFITIKEDGSDKSLLTIETADKPGLMIEILKIINDISVSVESAEMDTEGLIAKDKFHVSYGGKALSKSLSQVLTNCLRYYLRRPVEEESY
ncbi:ACT domain-containing protein ACR12 [Selaginella moellendorffii]|nr:ACT domain-containing protein ACR12 [Selaginella moellendorffii]XP_024535069.1 ACT domain-containing protein ACR12 [Selaginella moellendorffii]|eukprot:XP_002974263.2 ACT domain-containing protein ACR12 [Selaginella moellendorffii]